MEHQRIELKTGWKWKERDTRLPDVCSELASEDWRPVLAGMPSEIHVELMRANMIPHPFEGFNEHKVQCKPLFLYFELQGGHKLTLRRGRGARMAIYKHSANYF